MARHYARNVRYDRRTPTSNPDGSLTGVVVATFDCSCGMTDDQTVGETSTAARARAERICREHGATITGRISRAIR